MKVRFYCDIYTPPLYVSDPHPPFLIAYTAPVNGRPLEQDGQRISFEVEIPDHLIKREDLTVLAGAVNIA